MTQHNKGRWALVGVLSIGLTLGADTVAWMTPSSPMQATPGGHETHYEQQFAQLERAVTALTQSLDRSSAPDVHPEPTCVPAQSGDTVTQQALAHTIREELRQALAQWTPDSQRAQEEAIADAQTLNSPENQAAYQSAADVVHAAVGAKRWTEDDRRILQDALGHLTREQHQELMQILLPAINRGEIAVETVGPLL